MEELFCFKMTEEDYEETLEALAGCAGSKTRAALAGQVRMLWVMSGAILFVFWLIGMLRGVGLWIALVAVTLILMRFSLTMAKRFVRQQMQELRRQKKTGGSPALLGREQRIFLRDNKYVHQAGEQVVNAIPLATLREALPAGKGGVALLFDTGAEDYLPLRLFEPDAPAEDFCRRMRERAGQARQAPQDFGEPAGGDAADQPDRPEQQPGPAGQQAAYTLRFSLSGQQAVRLLAGGNVKLFFMPQRWKRLTRSLVLIGLVLALEWAIIGPLATLCIAAVFAAVILGPALPPVSRAIYARQLRKGGLDSLLGVQQLEFYENSVVIRRMSGEYEQRYDLFLKLLETADGWFLVGKSGSSMLPVPKDGLPPEQHAAFEAFLMEKLRTAQA